MEILQLNLTPVYPVLLMRDTNRLALIVAQSHYICQIIFIFSKTNQDEPTFLPNTLLQQSVFPSLFL